MRQVHTASPFTTYSAEILRTRVHPRIANISICYLHISKLNAACTTNVVERHYVACGYM